MYAGVGTEGLGLGNETISDNVFGALAEPVLGSPLDLFLFLAVIASSAASLITTFLPSQRTMLAMGTYRAFPQRFATVHPRYLTPSYANDRRRYRCGFVLCSAHVRQRERPDRHDLLARHHDLLLLRADRVRVHLVLPQRVVRRPWKSIVFKRSSRPLGGLGLLAVFLVTLRDSASPDYGQRCQHRWVGLVLILGLGLIVLGVAFMLAQRARDPAYFRGETLHKDTPAFVIDE